MGQNLFKFLFVCETDTVYGKRALRGVKFSLVIIITKTLDFNPNVFLRLASIQFTPRHVGVTFVCVFMEFGMGGCV